MTQATPSPTGSDRPQRRTKPPWLKVKLPTGEAYRKVRGLVSEHKLHTICESAPAVRRHQRHFAKFRAGISGSHRLQLARTY